MDWTVGRAKRRRRGDEREIEEEGGGVPRGRCRCVVESQGASQARRTGMSPTRASAGQRWHFLIFCLVPVNIRLPVTPRSPTPTLYILVFHRPRSIYTTAALCALSPSLFTTLTGYIIKQ